VEILPVVFKAGNGESSREPFRLYRPATGQWEDGYARYHQGYLSQKNSQPRTGGNFIPMIKILKHCRSLIAARAVSFHLDCLLYALPDRLFVGAPADYIPTVLGYIGSTSAASWYAQRMMTPCGERDIFLGTERKFDDWSEFHALIQRWSQLSASASGATDKQFAISCWQALLGKNYPLG
jgi:hypothetical protein